MNALLFVRCYIGSGQGFLFDSHKKCFTLMSELREALKEATQPSLSGKFAQSGISLSGRGQCRTTAGVSHAVQFELSMCSYLDY